MTNAPAANPLSGLSGSQMLPARAMGGQVTGGRAYMVGERGPEMIVPQRNGNVVPNNQLGGGVTVNQTINVSTGVQQTVRAEIKTLMPQIAEASKAAVADAVRRGGSYGRAFA
jgi:phage-related minor tail protein